MAGTRKSKGIEIPLCAGVKRDGTPCGSRTAKGWRYCPAHSERESNRLANEWGYDLERGELKGAPASILLPPLGKAVAELDREEVNALGRLIVRQLADFFLPGK